MYLLKYLNTHLLYLVFNPLTPRRTQVRVPLSPKFQLYFKKGTSKKIPMSVAPMSR